MAEARPTSVVKKTERSKRSVEMKSPAAPIKELKDTIRLAPKHIRKQATATREGRGRRAANIPMEVATPFPPLKFRKGVQLWPATAARPAAEASTISDGKK